jgi:hypothetical protein
MHARDVLDESLAGGLILVPDDHLARNRLGEPLGLVRRHIAASRALHVEAKVGGLVAALRGQFERSGPPEPDLAVLGARQTGRRRSRFKGHVVARSSGAGGSGAGGYLGRTGRGRRDFGCATLGILSEGRIAGRDVPAGLHAPLGLGRSSAVAILDRRRRIAGGKRVAVLVARDGELVDGGRGHIVFERRHGMIPFTSRTFCDAP